MQVLEVQKWGNIKQLYIVNYRLFYYNFNI